MANTFTRDKIKFSLLILIILASIFIVNMLDLKAFFSIDYLKDIILMQGAYGVAFFILLYIIATIFFIPGTPLTIASGVLFGKFWGTVYVVIGASIGATIAFLLARYLGASFVSKFLQNKYKKIYGYDKKAEDNGLMLVLFLRFVPVFPYNALNYSLGLTKVRFRDYLVGTFFGIIPGSFVLAYFGDSLAMLDIYNIVFAVLLFVLMSLIPLFYKKYSNKKATKK
ncbi:MAG: putative membrane protein YdjX (TVP38/TMEM64 family) [Patescibacteria group bacterium]|jgi:uncharacterized membrane protein YdjX (TVP38/TMEM64 family)